MATFSKEFEIGLKTDLLETVGKYLAEREKIPQTVTGLMTAQQVKDELGIKTNTLKRWEGAGLKRYQAPLEDTRKVFYKVNDILVFLGVENGR
ncbi:hypothetical protein [Streptococcus dysgalactiae]|mgnify:CR=1 FL=1|uniref:Phage protein n=1 Tax=Streptococcus dysgalactiae subsp. equisimilis TaxID=119602 RepID=A0AAE9QY39_STREQ|nr:hypothetical protein [Streptococcus dysgalactiae]QBX07688.1 hypothetical protein JavanS167_0006 [Streptococcus satellite phage Javan167]KKC22095.1 DNA-binding protein [Streptococcus dysgalactiae subsp. equisimilis]VDZ41448.1 phage protein [Streptococcus dysgalactiae subsp. dysgalactiae]VTT17573.1 phage protein [Streptococcus dysgalactiae]VTT23189.1 phage protein [Streptococcus dysgalactiae subsp. equisimilis]